MRPAAPLRMGQFFAGRQCAWVQYTDETSADQQERQRQYVALIGHEAALSVGHPKLGSAIRTDNLIIHVYMVMLG